MKEKCYKGLGRLVVALAIALFATVFIGTTHVYADNGETVRVSTAKQLNAAIKNPDVGTIIFRTQAYITLTIKQNKAASTKFLIVDAPNATITNKAVFADINIISATMYTENVSGNSISLSDSFIPEGFFIAKNKKVENVSVYSSYGIFFTDFTLRKGAKIKNLKMVFAGEEAPVESAFNSKKRELTIDLGNYYGTSQSYTFKLDKRGQIVKIACDADNPEFRYTYNYSFDSNGNLIKTEGEDNESGVFTTDFTYSGNLLQKTVDKGEFSSGITEFSYNSKGELARSEYYGEDSCDGESYTTSNIKTYEYDNKGRVVYETSETPESESFYEVSYTYNKNGLLTKIYINNSGSETVYTYKYNKAGDLISETYTSEGTSDTTKYSYDKLGNPLE